MPGITLIWGPDAPADVDAERWSVSAPSPACGPPYGTKIWTSEPGLLVASSGYEGYPVRSVSCDDLRLVVEGDVFPSTGSVEEWCSAVGRAVFSSRGACGELRSRLEETDGAFVLVASCSDTGELALVTDVLGRLPLYSTRASGYLMVSRDVTSVVRYSETSRLDRRAVAEHLAFGHGLGQRTLFDGVRRLDPGTVLRFEPGRSAPEEDSLPPLHFDREHWNGRDLEANAEALAGTFREAALRRHRPKSVVSLSGGLDSRAVAAALRSGGEDVRAATYLDSRGAAAEDARAASRIADCLDLEWLLFRLPPPEERHERDLGQIKAGLNPMRMAYILTYFEALLAHYGAGLTYFTGDGAVPALKPTPQPRPLRSVDDLVDLIVEKNCVLAPGTAASFVGLPEDVILESIREQIEAYPEGSLSAKYVRFYCIDRRVRYFSEGEDRNRYFFWTASPFMALPVLQFGATCPADQKAYYRLYREFLVRLSPSVAEIRRPAFAGPITGAITDRRHVVLRWLEKKIERVPAVKSLFDRIRKSAPEPITNDHPAARIIREFAQSDGRGVDHGLDLESIEGALDEGRLNEREAEQLRTLMSGAMVVAGASHQGIEECNSRPG